MFAPSSKHFPALIHSARVWEAQPSFDPRLNRSNGETCIANINDDDKIFHPVVVPICFFLLILFFCFFIQTLMSEANQKPRRNGALIILGVGGFTSRIGGI